MTRLFWLASLRGWRGEFKPSLVLQAVAGLGPMVPTTVREADGWLTVAPTDLLEATKSRSSRPGSGEFLRTLEERGYLGLDSVGKLAGTK